MTEIRAHSPQAAHTQPGSAKTVADILTAAADLIEPKGRWTQNAFARNAEGENTGMSEYSGPAVCWCTLGATERISPDHSADADAFLASFLRQNPGEWNDAPDRTQAEVVAALRAAAEKARTAASESAVGIAAGDEPSQSPNPQQGEK